MPEPYFADPDLTLYCDDAFTMLRELPDRSIHMACTSPPFFGLRDYGTGTWEDGDEGCDHVERMARQDYERPTPGGRGGSFAESSIQFSMMCGKCGAHRIDNQIGLESSPDLWAARLVDVFREVRRVLRDDGTLWVECGDSYTATQGGRQAAVGELPSDGRARFAKGRPKDRSDVDVHRWAEGDIGNRVIPASSSGLKPKDLIGQPWLLAFALRADGWYLRSCIVWSKPNAMPESVGDRPTSAHSYLFLFAKSGKPLFWTHSVLGYATRPKPAPDYWWFPPAGEAEAPSHVEIEGWKRKNAWRGHDYFYDAEALREPAEWARWGDQTVPEHEGTETASGWIQPKTKSALLGGTHNEHRSSMPGGQSLEASVSGQKNARTVWTIPGPGWVRLRSDLTTEQRAAVLASLESRGL